MSMLEGLASTLAEMGFVQLALVFLAVGAYSMAINGAFGAACAAARRARRSSAAVAFSALTPSWISGVVFLAVSMLRGRRFRRARLGWLAATARASAPSAAVVRRARKRAPAALPALQICARPGAQR